ncbi:alpha/beta hydrolase [Kocuria varians]|uniref:Alpha/beta hydrolase n=1 Tax=Kocuria varians TaxID=1272 RepID=A0A4Y4D728_KOCVA|nr:alpha/beta hydrolase [Kocuria varians]GED00133.1 alpha/beta hydrolase [Kocuria varians]
MSRSTFTTHTVRVNGTQLAYTDEGEGCPVVLLHGHAYDRSMWDAQVRTLTRRGWRVIAPDLRGFGDSEVTPGIVYTEEIAADVLALLDHLGLGSVVLVGFSMAGQVALQILAEHPERVAALVVNDTVPRAEDAAGRRRRHTGADAIIAGGMAAYAEKVLASMILAENVERLPDVARAVREMIAASPAQGAAAAMRGRAERQDFTATLRAWDGPALVVVGEGDAFDGGAAEVMADLLPRGELAVVPRSGHTPNMENPADYDAALTRFLDGLA